MGPRTNRFVEAIETPPIAAARGWLREDDFPATQPLIDLSQAVPGYPPDRRLTDHLAEQLTDQVRRHETALYTEIEGIAPLRAALAGHMTTFYDGPVGPEQVCITAGCNQAFFLAAMTLAKAGERIILPAPFYFNHRMSLDMLGIEAAPLPCREADGLVPDPDAAARLIDQRTRAIALVTPNNPTGAVYPPAIVDRFFELAQRHRIALIIDETYKDFMAPDQDLPHGLFQRADWPDTLVQLYSFSKAYAMPGYRVGSVIASARLIAELAKVMDCVSICAPNVGQQGALYGLRHLGDWRAEKRALMQDRTGAFMDALSHRNAGYRVVSIGAYFAYLRHPFAERSSADVARRLAGEQNLLCLPGTMFGPGQEPYLRFAFANVASGLMADIADRLAAGNRPRRSGAEMSG